MCTWNTVLPSSRIKGCGQKHASITTETQHGPGPDSLSVSSGAGVAGNDQASPCHSRRSMAAAGESHIWPMMAARWCPGSPTLGFGESQMTKVVCEMVSLRVFWSNRAIKSEAK